MLFNAMANSWEFSVEAFFVALLKADPRTAAKNVCHFEEEDQAKTKSIVVKAKQGGHTLAAFGGFEGEVEIVYRAPSKTSRAENDLTAKAIHEVVYESTISVVARAAMATAAGLSDLLIKDESTGDRQNTADLRKRSITLPIQARIA